MKKLKLDLEHLRIETFDPTPLEIHGTGTVAANSGIELSCADVNGTCGQSCNNDPLGGCGGTGYAGTNCGGTGGPSGAGTCACPTGNCVYPTAAYHSCDELGWQTNEYSCRCLYANTDGRICCSGAGCSGMC